MKIFILFNATIVGGIIGNIIIDMIVNGFDISSIIIVILCIWIALMPLIIIEIY